MTGVIAISLLGMSDYSGEDIAFMARVVDETSPTHIFEWGTNAGASARIFYELTQTRRPRVELHSIDWREPGSTCFEYPDLCQGYWVRWRPVFLHTGDGLKTTLALFEMEGPERALVYLDDGHLFQENLDALTALHREHPDAAILVDDARTGEPRAALEEFFLVNPDAYTSVSNHRMTWLIPRLEAL